MKSAIPFCMSATLLCLTSAVTLAQICVRPHTSGTSCAIPDPSLDPAFVAIVPSDYSSGNSPLIPLDFTFNHYGNIYNTVYINENGNLSFSQSISEVSMWNYFENENRDESEQNGFADMGIPIIAPFYSQVNLGMGGALYYKSESTRLTISWRNVTAYIDYSGDESGLTNTFQVIITDGNDPLIGIGNNVLFSYGDMQQACGLFHGNGEYINQRDGFYGWPAAVGVSKGNGISSCDFRSLGYFNRPDNVDRGCIVPPSEPGDFYSNQEYFDNEFSGINLLDNQCFAFSVAQSPMDEVSVNFSYQSSFCATIFEPDVVNPNNCSINSYEWNFDDNNTSTEANPVHSYQNAGDYSVTLTIGYSCGGESCVSSASSEKTVSFNPGEPSFKDTTITVATRQINQVLSASASTFSDAWPIDHPDEALNDRQSYLNGSQGVWRQKESFVYDVPRQQASASGVDPAKDGYFTLETFNWEKANLRAIPNWLPANEVTKYSPYGYELENRDVLNRHSAALYSYGGQLPHAIGTNMQHREMAYTGFEYLNNQRDGNWLLGIPSTPAYQRYEVQTGRKRIVLVKASLAELEDADAVDVVAKRFLRPARYVAQNPIVCRYSYEDNPDWSVLVLERPVVESIWWGHIILRNNQGQATPIALDWGWSHTGLKSLKVTTDLTLPQKLLALDSGKQYLISAWVSVKNLALSEPKLADGIGLRLIGRGGDDAVVLDETFSPTGPVVEGWQQLQGRFVCPKPGTKLTLTFKKGNAATAWFDDLRLHPVDGNLQAYVYDPNTFRLQATLDENGYATLYYYDQEGNLYLTKKETERGIQTIQESIDYQATTD